MLTTITRAQAAALRLPTFFTDVPCKRGHLCERYTSVGNCIRCIAESTKAWRPTGYESPSKTAQRQPGRDIRAALAKDPRVISRSIAKALKLKRYFTGRPCSEGHLVERLVSNGRCLLCLRALRRKWTQDNPEKAQAQSLRYYHRHPGVAEGKRRAAKANPPWVDRSEITKIYKACPAGMVVDHIIPLNGRTIEGWRISGLHVPWNLQYLPEPDNRRKYNRMRAEDMILCAT